MNPIPEIDMNRKEILCCLFGIRFGVLWGNSNKSIQHFVIIENKKKNFSLIEKENPPLHKLMEKVIIATINNQFSSFSKQV